MAYSPTTRTTQDVATSVKRTFGDESGVQLTDSDILMWINDAQEEIVKRNKVLKATATSAAVVGQADYAFPTSNILQIESLHYDGSKLENIPFVEAENDFISPENAGEVGIPQVWWEWGGSFTLWPAPDDTAAIKLYFTQSPAIVTSVSAQQVLSLPDKYFRQIVNYVLQQAYEMDENWDGSQIKGQQFDTDLQAMGQEERSAENMTYPVVNLVYP